MRNICESYQGLTPADIEDLTLDQIYVMTAPKAELASLGGMATMTIAEARGAGVVANPPKTGGASLVQRVKAQKEAQREADKKKSKRQRRREWERDLKERRERGEVI